MGQDDQGLQISAQPLMEVRGEDALGGASPVCLGQETADALLSAHREAPAEVRDRPGIRRIATELTERHPRANSVRQLAAALHAPSV